MLHQYIDREVKIGSYSANYLSYILLENNSLTILGNTIKVTAREKKYLCEIKKANSTIKDVKCENYKEARVDSARDEEELMKI